MQVEHVERPIDNYWQVALASIYSVHMYIFTLSKSQVSEVLHVAQYPLRTRRQSHYNLRAMEEQEANFSGELYSICLTSCEVRLTMLDLCSEGHGRLDY